MPDFRPVGVFDSGVGGLSIVREMRRLMPMLDIVYVSDARFLPYGDKSEAFIRARAFAISEFLLAQGARALVVACNTATAAAALDLRARFRLPIVGIEPAVKPASAATGSGIVAILATASTLQSHKYAQLLERFGGFVRVISQPCSGLVECVEAGELDGPRTRALLRGYVEPLLQAGADTLVLGCTHYPFLIEALRALVGNAVHIVDPGAAVARRIAHLLRDDHEGAGSLRCHTSGDHVAQQRVMTRLLGEPVAVAPLPESFCMVKVALPDS
ncbi:MAG: glutamate racemase [Gammaproteobacteria bacterium]|jgi:glutamate racemase|nr:glutamate racemase [Gammaproteobacteria bacterium]MBP6053942.1 glutamate racemase [Pseudomonadales bacterium]MBK6584601.1 glutamate racemase [Gammaproteobacteria bacterium]MBK7170902.1 glutamate racemase [Gammaproteobacteria bacterium]MBK7519889.1 glutamate racemase [Gammaproteobacteria bacterium]